MGRGVEKARIAFAAAENGAAKLSAGWSGSAGAAALGGSGEGATALGGVGGAGWRKDRAFACRIHRFDGVPQSGFQGRPWPTAQAAYGLPWA